MGQILRLVLLYEIHRLARFPSVQDCASYCRVVKCSLVKCRKESGGNRVGTSGKTIGNAPLQWAFAEAAPLFLRNHLQGQKLLARLEKTHDTGKALRILAPQLGRAVYFMRKRKVAFARDRFLHTSGSRAGEPGASLAIKGMRLKRARSLSDLPASVNAKACLGRVSLSPGD